MRSEFIQTSIRPIKKLFIIEEQDYTSFENIFLKIKNEIDIIQNLLFINNDELWTQSNKDFIKRNDPDIILNLSQVDNEKLSNHFGITSVTPDEDKYKIGRFGTNIYAFTRKPSYYNVLVDNHNEPIKILSTKNLTNTPLSLVSCINYGLYQDDIKDLLRLSIFRNLEVKYLTSKKEILNSLFETNSFIKLTNKIGEIGGSGYGGSIYEIDYNEKGLFSNDKKYFFISEKNDFKTISFFWNTRAYYSNSKLVWIPIDFINDISKLVDNESIFICFDENIKNVIKKEFGNNQIIQPTRLHFMGKNTRWAFYKHSQTINFTGNELIIQHPVEKSFIDIGAMAPYVLEVSGLAEFLYQKRKNIGKLFFPKNYDVDFLPERFQRISEKGLAKYVLSTSFLNPEDAIFKISLPTFKEVVDSIFMDTNYSIKTTHKSSILEQTLNLFDGFFNVKYITDKKIFDILVSLTPILRTDKAIKKFISKESESDVNQEEIREHLTELRDKELIQYQLPIMTIKDILTNHNIKKANQKNYINILQKLYNQDILLSGKYFDCPYCNSKIWIQLDTINRTNYCNACNNKIDLPIVDDYFKLNQLIIRAIDQGQLATLLTLNFFHLQPYYGFEYLSNLEIIRDDTLITDIDLLIKIGKRIGIVECKSNDTMQEKQINEFIDIAKEIKCDFVAFSTLLSSSDSKKEIDELVSNINTAMNKKDLKIPVFIITGDILFSQKKNKISEYFELRNRDTFITGAILLEELKD